MREIAALMALKRFNHPNITRLHDAFIMRAADGSISLNVVFERCNWDLYEFLNKIPRDMGEGQIKNLARQIFRGVDFLHANSLIHRDPEAAEHPDQSRSEKIGTPAAVDWPSDAVVDHSFFSPRPPVPLGSFVPRMCPLAVQLLHSLLQFSSHLRPTAADCLTHPYFRSR
ncbi:Cyclin-dependent kinase CDK-4 [Aphelenchoides fujianensis]|nr:Cyclin-dependent kinase CDK-4 [Aphelenchoides fujianensis]